MTNQNLIEKDNMRNPEIIYKSSDGFIDIPEKVLENKKWLFFDMDGTLIDLERSNYELYREVIDKMYGLELSEDDWGPIFAGRRPQDSIPDFLTKKGRTEEVFQIDEFVKYATPIKSAIIFEKLFDNSKLITGAKEYLAKVTAEGYHLILVTSTISLFAESILSQYGIRECFDQIITGEDVKKGKPDPQVYLFALERSGASPKNVVVFEDSESGIKSALSANLDCVLIGQSTQK